mmetsp:Transcript_14115/g.25292  ORF Transcript_14115/g.25292 Transcript_14115/m.25292 type:complete len:270 (-) Transcript_14115:109-918(-)
MSISIVRVGACYWLFMYGVFLTVNVMYRSVFELPFPHFDDSYHIGKVRDEPIGLFLDGLSFDHSTESNKCLGGRFGLSIRGSVSDHDHGLISLLGLKLLQGLGLSHIGRGGFVGIESLVGSLGSVVVKPQGIGNNVGNGNVERLCHGFNHDSESSRHQPNVDIVSLQRGHEGVNAGRQHQGLFRQQGLDLLFGGFQQVQSQLQGFLELHASFHGLFGQGGDLLSLSEIVGQHVNALFGNDCRIDVKTDGIGVVQCVHGIGDGIPNESGR